MSVEGCSINVAGNPRSGTGQEIVSIALFLASNKDFLANDQGVLF